MTSTGGFLPWGDPKLDLHLPKPGRRIDARRVRSIYREAVLTHAEGRYFWMNKAWLRRKNNANKKRF